MHFLSPLSPVLSGPTIVGKIDLNKRFSVPAEEPKKETTVVMQIKAPTLPGLTIVGKINLQTSSSVVTGEPVKEPGIIVQFKNGNKIGVEPINPLKEADSTFKFMLNRRLKVAKKSKDGIWVCEL